MNRILVVITAFFASLAAYGDDFFCELTMDGVTHTVVAEYTIKAAEVITPLARCAGQVLPDSRFLEVQFTFSETGEIVRSVGYPNLTVRSDLTAAECTCGLK